MNVNIADKINPLLESTARYHWSVTKPLVDVEPLFVQKMPVWKRAMDVAVSAAGLIVLLPLFAVVGIYIKLVSPGPVFFKQERVGYGGRFFSIIKFRTMHPDVDNALHARHMVDLIGGDEVKNNGKPTKKLLNDPRIIPFGNILRTTAIDELPQLFNILAGDMSLVGPRPPISYEVDLYKYWHASRFDTVPGLTGLWQVSGKNKLAFNEMIRLDIRYIEKQSFWLDLKILLLTPFVIFSQIIHPQGNS